MRPLGRVCTHCPHPQQPAPGRSLTHSTLRLVNPAPPRLVEGIISELQAGGGEDGAPLLADADAGGGEGGWASLDAPAGAPGGEAAEAAAALSEELVLLGFQQADASAAVAAVGAAAAATNGGGGGEEAPSLSAALDWLCVRLPEDRLPKNFAPGGWVGGWVCCSVVSAPTGPGRATPSERRPPLLFGLARAPPCPAHRAGAAGKPISIIRRGGGGGGSAASLPSRGGSFATGIDAAAEAAEEAAAAAEAMEDPAVAELATYGYPPAAAVAALELAGGHVHRALAALHARISAAATGGDAGEAGEAAAAAAAAGAAGDAELAEWLEEREALEAIYGGDVAFHSPAFTALRLPVELHSAAATAAAGGRHELTLQLDFFAPPAVDDDGSDGGGAAAPYPARPPVVGVRCEGAPPAALLTLTRQLAEVAAGLAGHPMLYELASAATERLEGCLQAPLPLSQLLPRAAPSRGGSAADLAAAAEQQLRLEDIANTVFPSADRRRPRQQGGAPRIDVAAESRRLAQWQRELETGAAHAAMRGTRSRLPAAAKRAELLELCRSHRVVVVSGATGCGKSTQAPQFLLEEAVAAGAGAACNIIVTQPRRISAVGLASRVAAERGEQARGRAV